MECTGRENVRKTRDSKEKKIVTERDIARERVSMFETSHWFLLSGMLVSQELDCSTLPLTDSRPAV